MLISYASVMEEDTTSPVPWRQMVRLPDEWGERVERLAHEHGVPVAIMLRLLVRSGLEQWEARHDSARTTAR
jgi:predicted DNA-binding protein